MECKLIHHQAIYPGVGGGKAQGPARGSIEVKVGVRLVRALLTVAGLLSLVLGIAGVFLPLLPTTPFLLFAAFCFSRSSPRLTAWLLASPMLGAYIRAWRQDGRVPIRVKRFALFTLTVTMGTSVGWFVEPAWLKVALTATGCGVFVYILRLPSR